MKIRARGTREMMKPSPTSSVFRIAFAQGKKRCGCYPTMSSVDATRKSLEYEGWI